ncbi:plant UBX domain-containing protein 4-like [Senna tora]|uniref:Plant UBX domain-containing protein 4-like n=1 Tax=Senna tora TaxID=362788 RepID=A0A835C5K0_9FABA|nr:plant UBX domain-containing protein 4-like [Senna tora]
MDIDSNPDAHAALIISFCEITSASHQEAVFYLESHNFDLDAAVSTFLDSTSHHNITGGTNDVAEDNILPPSAEFPMPSHPPIDPASMTTAPGMAPKNPSGSGTGGIRTNSNLKRPAPDSTGCDSGESEENNAGGGPKSVDDILNQARQLAVGGPPEYPQSSATPKGFTGTSRSLSENAVLSTPQPPQTIRHRITFWRNGFSIDNGPLRRLNDPENASFLESIKMSECPKELEPADRRSTVEVSLTRRDDNYPEPSQKGHGSFLGVGRTLGSSSSSSDAAGDPNLVTALGASSGASALPSMGPIVDDSKPVTLIQIMLIDGTRMVSRFNRHHTIRDIRGFLDASSPGGAVAYRLRVMGFPPKQLTDLNQTIEQAGIIKGNMTTTPTRETRGSWTRATVI